VCSSSARLGHFLWCGADRPSPDYANAQTILLLSSHLETGHYFNPHAQRIMESKSSGGTLICIDPRLSNTSAKADIWMPAYSGTEGALLLAIARILLEEDLFNREFVRKWVNWREYLAAERPDLPQTFDAFVSALKQLYAQFTPEYAEAETGVRADQIVAAAHAIGRAGTRFATHNWRAAASGNLWGWQITRCLYLLVVARERRRRQHARHEQVRAEASESAAAAELLERAPVPEGVSALLLRAELPAPPLPEGRARQARRLFHPRL
jgi:anaerobic selenocysteine-containing dehydrogenase